MYNIETRIDGDREIGLIIVKFSGEDIENKVVARITPKAKKLIQLMRFVDEEINDGNK